MLKPAIAYKDQLDKLFAEHIYNKDMFFYMGYPHCHELPNLEMRDSDYKWVSVDKNNNVIGYFAYRVDLNNDSVYSFGLYSFDRGNLMFIRDVYNKLDELLNIFTRIEWRCIDGNPALSGYKRFCKKHNGYTHHLHKVTKDNQGCCRDEWVFEIIAPVKFST